MQTKRKRMASKGISLSEASKIRRRLLGMLNGTPTITGYVASDPWAQVCVSAIERGVVQLRKSKTGVERDLYREGVYPPGGAATSMVETEDMRWMPPDYTGKPLDQREDSLTFAQGCKMPCSPSALAIARIAHVRARPIKGRVH